MLDDTVLAITAGAGIFYVLGFLVTIVRPKYRIWPLGEKSWESWETWFNWVLGTVMFAGFPILGYFGWGSFVFPTVPAGIVGSALIVFGLAITLQGVSILGVETSVGGSGTLNTGGLYRYTRNPQIIGNFIILLGLVLALNAWRVVLLSAVAYLWHFFLPFVEEPWLRAQFGEEYEEFCDQTPRFVDTRTFRRLWRDCAKGINDVYTFVNGL